MRKDTHFIGQPTLNQLIFFLQWVNICKIAEKYLAERYVKKLDTRKHLIIMIFSVMSGCQSLREVLIGMLSQAHKLCHLLTRRD